MIAISRIPTEDKQPLLPEPLPRDPRVDQLFAENTGWAVTLAERRCRRIDDLDDLAQIALQEMFTAAGRYDGRGKLTTYSTHYINRGIRAFYHEKSNMKMGVPYYLYHQYKNFKKASTILAIELKREPTAAEVADYINVHYLSKRKKSFKLDETHIRALKKIDEGHVVEYNPRARRNKSSYVDDPSKKAEMNEELGLIIQAMEQLEPEEQELVRLHLGIGMKKGLTFRELEGRFGRSHTTLGTRFNRAIEKIRQDVYCHIF